MTPADALTKIEAELAAATPDDLLHRVITAWDHEFTHPANSAVDIVQARIAVQVLRPTYLAALVGVAKAAANVRRQYERWAIGLRWDIAKANDDLFAALDALTKAVQ